MESMQNNNDEAISRYEAIDWKYRDSFNRRCIDGKIIGCGKCVGYCEYEEHPGFLTYEQRRQHNCIEKNCFYYVDKQKSTTTKKIIKSHDSEIILRRANQYFKNTDGIKVIRVIEDNEYSYTLQYIAITNDFSLTEYIKLLSDEFNYQIRFQRLNYDFDVCCAIITGDSKN